MTVIDAIGDLPEPVARVLREVTGSAQTALGATLHSVVLFGSGAENRLRTTSDVNLLIVLSAFEPARIGGLSGVLQRAQSAIRLSVMWLLQSELAAASDAFAV